MGRGIVITNAIKKYGKENFNKEILEYINDDEKHKIVSEREIFWIKEENTLCPSGYNISPGGEGGCTKESAKKGVLTKKKNGYIVSEETKKKISDSKKGKQFTEEHKNHLSENHRNKTLHILVYSDGKIERTKDSLRKIASKNGITCSALVRASQVLSFRYGLVVFDNVIKEIAFDHRFANTKSREKVFENPINHENISPIEWRIFREHNKDLMKFPKHPYNKEWLLKRDQFYKGIMCIIDTSLDKIKLNGFWGIYYVED